MKFKLELLITGRFAATPSGQLVLGNRLLGTGTGKRMKILFIIKFDVTKNVFYLHFFLSEKHAIFKWFPTSSTEEKQKPKKVRKALFHRKFLCTFLSILTQV